jgi:transcriptional regulator with XRE-family HTH domain
MDRGITLKEAAAIFGVTDTAVINWEIRGKMPDVGRIDKVNGFITNCSVH